MKIGFDCRPAKWYRGTGIGTYAYQLLNMFNNIDKVNDYVLFAPSPWDMNINLNSNFLTATSESCGSGVFWDEVNMPNIIKDKNLDIYHVPQNGVGLSKDKICKYVITLHDVIPYRMPNTASDRYLKIFNEEIPKVIPLCDGIITVSNFSKRDIIRSFNCSEDKVYVTHLAAEDIYKPLSKSKSCSLIKHNYGIDGDFILYIGGFSPRKNIIGLIESFSKLITLYKKNISLVIAGTKGKSYDLYHSRAIDLNIENKVIFPGFIEMNHIPYIYNAAKLFVYPSFYEGFGLPPVEAMACGTPVVTSNSTSIPEIVGDAAILMDPYDVDDLCEKMYLVLTNKELKDSLVSKGLARSSELSWEKTAKQTLDAYSSIHEK